MHSDPAIERRAAVRGRRRTRRTGSAEGPVFVDASGRRARVLRRIGLLLGAVCAGYAVVLGLAFLGIGTSASPASLLPFGNEQGAAPEGGAGPRGGAVSTGAPPSGRPTAPPSGAPTPTATAVPSPTATVVPSPTATVVPSPAATS
ncbi:hypothetical protein N4P33_33335 [Streptomyces sp. 15-116A]|uniref:hypothetical protein n=1 Tax=Streptomyces sp. 15-116A TaxID=2259035 RepID=UPI0021B1A209|nr:hypothetical protein [Streptomyces sp. 15-116A]MCT7356989.1 hypothetical protein [Streptomyces sp. 15-116A]